MARLTSPDSQAPGSTNTAFSLGPFHTAYSPDAPVTSPHAIPAVPLAFQPEVEPLKRPGKSWVVLLAAEHTAAGFDAWSTREGVSQGRVEVDPMMRPFAHSAAIYGAIQVVPLGLDYAAHRMRRSSGWMRHIWWLPQSFATASFLFSGSYNSQHAR